MAELLSITIEALGSSADREIRRLLWCVRDKELESLMNTVSIIIALLQDAKEKQAAGDHAVRDRLGMLLADAYDADDLLDAISTEALRRKIMTHHKKAKQVRIFFSKSNQLAHYLRMGPKIKAIRKTLDAINPDGGILHSLVRHVETRIGDRERDNTHSLVSAEAVIGRENDKKTVIRRLLDSNVEGDVSVLPIVGIGGLGKTTLAQLIFNDEEIQQHFQLKMWVCVSETFDVQNIVEKILQSVTKTKQPAVEMDKLEGKLKKKINRRTYLLVLDDVWNENYEKWSRLKELLMGGARGSRIVVTTRSARVARITGTVQSYSLRGLDEVSSWSLLKQMPFEKRREPANSSIVAPGRNILAFEKGKEPENSSIVALGREGKEPENSSIVAPGREGKEPENSSIVALERDMLKKCVGVPLAIRTVGSFLGSQNSLTGCLSFKNIELSNKYQNQNNILQTLKLSYDHLPLDLKRCFAYCSLFPKDYMIDKLTLIKLWIAQGFVKSWDQKRCLEDVGDDYFMKLSEISFFKETEMDEEDNIIGCKIHELMHDLAISVARSLTTTLDDNNRDVDEKTRHVSFGCNIHISSVEQLKEASRMRTFFLLDNYSGAEIDCVAIFPSLKVLRVLDMHKRNLDYVPNSIGKLKYLRYLDLSRNYNIKKLPDSISRLQNLQTLRLSKCGSLKELPRDIVKLVNLRHLEMDGCMSLEELPRDIKKLINLRHLGIDECYRLTYMPRGLGQLTNLQKLSRFVVHSSHKDSSGLKELHQLNNLRGKLVIENLEHEKGVESEYKAANLIGKQHLQTLHLWWSSQGDVNDLDIVNDEASLEVFQPHLELKYLRLGKYRGSKLPSWFLSLKNLVSFELFWCKKCQCLSELSLLPSLKYLVLISLDAMEYISDRGDGSEKIQFFPSLKEMSLSGCRKLKGWWRDSSVDVNSDGHNSIKMTKHCFLPSFPLLSTLSISSCPMLTSMPMFPHLEEKLVLDNPTLKLLEQVMTKNMAAPQSPTSTSTTSTSSSSIPLSKLKYMELNSVADLETLPEEWLQNLTSLKSLKIGSCKGLKSLPTVLQHATTLQKLEISNCENLSLASLPERMHRILVIDNCPKIAHLSQRCERDR